MFGKPQFSKLQVQCLWQKLTKSNTVSRNIENEKMYLENELLNTVMFKKHF